MFIVILPIAFSCIGVWIGLDGFDVPPAAVNATCRWVSLFNASVILAGHEILAGAEDYWRQDAEQRQQEINDARAAALDEFLANANLSMELLEEIQAERQRTGFNSGG